MTAAACTAPAEQAAEAVDLLALQRRERALDAIWPLTDVLIAVVHSRHAYPEQAAEAVADVLASVQEFQTPDGTDPLVLLALALADRCAGYMLALGITP